jgi:hypothetical protein
VKAEKNCGDTPAREFSDYEVKIDKAALPKGVEMIEMV